MEVECTRSVLTVIEYIILSTKWIIWKRRNILKYDSKWISEQDTIQWVKCYLVKRTEILLCTGIEQEIKTELIKLKKGIVLEE